MAFTTNLSGTAQVSDALITLWDRAFIIASEQDDVVSQFADVRTINGKSDIITTYNTLGLATTPLTETEDVVSESMGESKITVTPQEYGNVVTRTSLASLQTGGQVDMAAAQLVGRNMGRTMNKLATLALEASTNVKTVANKAAGDLLAADVISLAEVNAIYNKLARSNVMSVADGMFIAFAHDDVINDIRAATGAGSWQDVTKYADPVTALRNEVGMFGGFRWIRNNDCAFGDQAGAGTVDVYKTTFMGAQGLVKGVSKEAGMVATGPFDKLNRFVNLGWYGVLQYLILEQQAVWQLQSASSVGANAA